jgi:hypothetical protein
MGGVRPWYSAIDNLKILCTDSEGDALRYTLYVNGTDYFTKDYNFTSFFTYYNDTNQIIF